MRRKMVELKAGDKAPLFTLPASDGKSLRLGSLLGKKEVILYFYPKDNTPGCTREACGFQEALAGFKKAKAVVLGLSKDSVASHQRFAEKFNLSFPLLSDLDTEVCKAYGVYQLKKNYGREYWGIVRSTFIIGLDGRIIACFYGVKVNGHVEAVLATLKEAQTARKRKKPQSK